MKSETLVDGLKYSVYPEIYYALRKLDLTERVHWLEGAFSDACNYISSDIDKADEKALLILNWFMDAMKDLERDVTKEQNQDESHLKRFRVGNIMSILSEVPMHAYHVMPKTKELIFSELVGWCYETTDEEESDKIFKLFCSMEFMCFEDRKQLENIFRDKTDSKYGIPNASTRLFRHMQIAYSEMEGWKKNTLNNPKLQVERIGEILFNAWRVRVLKNFKDMVRVVQIIQPLEGVSDKALESLNFCAKMIAKIEKQNAGCEYYITDIIWSCKKHGPHPELS
ncbi:MAG: hypothetical protein ABSE68_03215 [Minisyncoccia bacterium]